ncbi:NAD-dependent epimerase/dehydratase family protein [Winogradskyella sp. 3972H.M.0a.05]|uniref:NAD-dependent epimerase/dehydratase family protein n=1 Tax=Winogradskyella sp. 3972H.M.0a.05 TaxID=2950277 RepID=UPI0033982105
MILVTGGTGLVGSHLLYKLVESGNNVRAIYRRQHKLEHVKHVFSYYSDSPDSLFDSIEWIEADLNDIPALETAFDNVDYVYHCAAFVSFEPDKYHLLRQTNIDGTANIVNLGIKYNVKKLCYVSSIAAIGSNENPETLITEETAWNTEDDNSVYAISKYGAELEVWRGTQEGLDAVAVNPGIILGPGFWHGAGSGSLFKGIYKGMKYYTEGITGFVDIWDVVDPMISLMDSSIKNQGYILISENMSFKDFQVLVAESLDVKPSHKKASNFMLQIAWRLDWLAHKLLGKRRRLSKNTAKSLQSKALYDNSKIKEALNYEFKSIKKSVEEISSLFLQDNSIKT